MPITDARRRAHQALTSARLAAPVTVANRARNARAEPDRHARWSSARDAAWELLSELVIATDRVAIVGAGNGDTLPLGRLAERVRQLTLIDLDAVAIRQARRRRPRTVRPRIELLEHDITGGAANAIAASATHIPDGLTTPQPLPGSPYDLVIGDLFYSQLLYPALLDLEFPDSRVTACLERSGPPLTRAVVGRMHASARQVIHIDDPIGWWPGHPQPVSLERILTTAQQSAEAALALARGGNGPRHTDPRAAVEQLGLTIQRTALWRWPFKDGVDYLAAATVAGPAASERAAGERADGAEGGLDALQRRRDPWQ